MSQTDVDVQLKVWKDLAISKQILMGVATDALGLDAKCSAEELSTALTTCIKRSNDADASVTSMREKTDKELAEIKALLKVRVKELEEVKARLAETVEGKESAERRVEIGRSENLEALKKAKTEVAEEQQKLKAISKALADTPENVIKKLKVLKKQKVDEAKMRAQVETALQATRKDKLKLEQEVEEQKTKLEQVPPLVTQVRELYDLCKQANKKISALSEDSADILEIPELDEDLLKSLVKADDDADDNTEDESEAKAEEQEKATA